MIRRRVEVVCGGLGRRVDVIANNDGTRIDEDLERAYAEMAWLLGDKYDAAGRRYAGSALMRPKLGAALRRDNAPHIFETRAQAWAFLAAR